jgi:hypothetical protein
VIFHHVSIAVEMPANSGQMHSIAAHQWRRGIVWGMRGILRGRSCRRDGKIAAQAVATALAYQVLRPAPTPPNGQNNRLQEVIALFDAAKQFDSGNLASLYVEAAARLARLVDE